MQNLIDILMRYGLRGKKIDDSVTVVEFDGGLRRERGKGPFVIAKDTYIHTCSSTASVFRDFSF